ncbi:MFS transporter [Thermogemmatispora sp.]|uniref:MFS transporter n=1 Tax=Thermogemmatispora sp. TaxID=1968838 RepID=UPI002ACBE6B3|nr:MFS transporter [Thermogemmatispora sp.]
MDQTAGMRPLSLARRRWARLAVAFLFFLNGVLLATWAARIPAIQTHLALAPAILGSVLFSGAAGALAGMSGGGYLAARYGSRRIVILATLSLCLMLTLVAVAPSLPLLIASVALLGASSGAMDVSMNTQGVAAERLYGQPILNSFHACYSLGSLAGSLRGGLIAGYGIPLLPHFSGVALAGAILTLCCIPALLPSSHDQPAGERTGEAGRGVRFARPSRATLALGLIAFCSLFGEGAMADWSALYLNNNLHSGAGLAPIGYAIFSVMMMTSRGLGDALTARVGAALMVRLGGLLAASGLTLVLLSPWLVLALCGFVLIGCGLSVTFPLTLSAAGRLAGQGQATSTALAAVATCGYTGLMAGPPTIGFVASFVGLRLALGIIILLSLSISLLAGATEDQAPSTPQSLYPQIAREGNKAASSASSTEDL